MATTIFASTSIAEVDRLAAEAGVPYVGTTSMNGIFQIKEDHTGTSATWHSFDNNGWKYEPSTIDYDVARHWPHP